MFRILFWNMGRKGDTAALSNLCREHKVDVAVLAEFSVDQLQTEAAISSASSVPYGEHVVADSLVRFFVRAGTSLQLSIDEDRASIRRCTTKAGTEILIAGVHLPSKLWSGQADQHHAAKLLRLAIEQAEVNSGHRKTVIIGDLNMNPFDLGMVAADGLHGVMDRSTALREQRIYQGVEYRLFYNPMWSFLGDLSSGPTGTYYRSDASLVSHFWHTVDQMLIRPALIPHFPENGITVLTTAGAKSLLRNGKIDKVISDHLPILVTLNI